MSSARVCRPSSSVWKPDEKRFIKYSLTALTSRCTYAVIASFTVLSFTLCCSFYEMVAQGCSSGGHESPGSPLSKRREADGGGGREGGRDARLRAVPPQSITPHPAHTAPSPSDEKVSRSNTAPTAFICRLALQTNPTPDSAGSKCHCCQSRWCGLFFPPHEQKPLILSLHWKQHSRFFMFLR